MKTVIFTINGDAAAAIDKTIKLRAASPHVSNIVEVRIVRPQALPTTYTVKFVIPEHVEIDVAYKLGGVNKNINALGHDASESERTITVDAGSVVNIQLAVDTGWTLDDASEKSYTITANKTITIDTPYVAGPTPYTLSWNIGPADNIASYDSPAFGITYIAKDHATGGMKPAETIDIAATGSKTVYEGDKVVFWDNCGTNFSATGATMSSGTITIGKSDVQVVGTVPIYEIPEIPKCTVTFITKPYVRAHITCIQDGSQQTVIIDNNSSDKTINVDENSDMDVLYTTSTNYHIGDDEKSLSLYITEDDTIEFPEAIYEPPIDVAWDTNSFIGCEDYSLGTPPTNLAGRFKIQEPFLNSIGDEVYQDIEFILSYIGTDTPAGKPSEYNVTLTNRGTGTPTTEYWAVTDEGSGGGHGKLVLIKNPFDDYYTSSSIQFDGEIILKDPEYNDDDHVAKLWFSILLTK